MVACATDVLTDAQLTQLDRQGATIIPPMMSYLANSYRALEGDQVVAGATNDVNFLRSPPERAVFSSPGFQSSLPAPFARFALS